MPRITPLLDQISFARAYTTKLVDAIDPADWFRFPPAGVSHVAWQVGHLAMAQYRLGLDRIRGPRSEDDQLIDPAFLALFGRDSVPDANPARYPRAAEIRAVFDRVHVRLQEELPGLSDEDLDGPLSKPHALAKTRQGALLWCAQHEMLHAGQIGLLRRQLGFAPLW